MGSPRGEFEKIRARREAKKKRGKLGIQLDKQIGLARVGREQDAEISGRDALSLLGGGDVERRQTILSSGLDLDRSFVEGSLSHTGGDSEFSRARRDAIRREARILENKRRKAILG